MKFIHFGCWNNGPCNIESGDNGLSKTMRKLRSYITTNPIDFLVVAGDNYYPSKVKKDKGEEKAEKAEKIKTLNVADLKSGFACLPKAVKKYILFGNHEYDETRLIINEGASEAIANEEKCKILTLEQEQSKIIDTRDNINLFEDVIFLNKEGTLLIMIDTTIYEDENDDIKSFKDSCLKKIFPTLQKKDTIQDFITHQETRIRDILAENQDARNIIFVGHHPIITVKYKIDKDKAKTKISSLEKFKQLFININPLLLGKNKYYLCADTHLYQHGKVTIKSPGIPDIEIDQYTCGTGGAEQDDCPPTLSGIFENKDKTLTYNMDNCSKIFGFLVVNIKDGVINFNFENTEESGTGVVHGGSYYSKYLKYKVKYEKLKLQYQQY
jgi:predicted MPP superfamily phosphohydrolase